MNRQLLEEAKDLPEIEIKQLAAEISQQLTIRYTFSLIETD